MVSKGNDKDKEDIILLGAHFKRPAARNVIAFSVMPLISAGLVLYTGGGDWNLFCIGALNLMAGWFSEWADLGYDLLNKTADKKQRKTFKETTKAFRNGRTASAVATFGYLALSNI